MSDSEYKRADTLLEEERPGLRRRMERHDRGARDPIPPKMSPICPARVGDRPKTLCGFSVKDLEEGKREKAVRCDGGGIWWTCTIYKERGPIG